MGLSMKCVAIMLMLLPTMAFADNQEVGASIGAKKADSLSYTQEQYTKKGGDASTNQVWYGAKSGGLKAAVSEDQKSVDAQLNTSVGELMDVSALKGHWFNSIQFEGRAGTGRPSYGLIGIEGGGVNKVTLFGAMVYNSGSKAWRPIGGPIFYWSKSHSMLMLYPTIEQDSPVKTKGSVALRNRIREFGPVWIDTDLSYKVASNDKGLQGRLGYGAAVGFWKAALSYKFIPYYENSAWDQTSLQASYLYNL